MVQLTSTEVSKRVIQTNLKIGQRLWAQLASIEKDNW